MAEFNEEKQEKKLETLRRHEEEELARMLSEKYGIGYVDLTQLPIDTDSLRLVHEEKARDAGLCPFNQLNKKVSLAVISPNNQKVKEIVDDLTKRGFVVSLFMASHLSLDRAWSRYKDLSFAIETKAGVLDISGEEVQHLMATIHSIEDVVVQVTSVLGMKKIYKISRILETILAGALATFASDVHIEPEEISVKLRYRLDGVLTDILSFDHETHNLLLSRMKLLSGLKINIKNAAQDGRFSVRIDNKEIEIRTSVLPGNYGESVVLRVLDPTTLTIPMEKLGMNKKLFPLLEREIHKPNGMILNTGPTGSGKTTTLYAFLQRVKNPQIKIITIEDPIEYHVPGIVQTQVNKKDYTFELGLRSSLRQDPDIIMVGEIRDPEVADTAIQASLTGHLVFSTLHTNTAAGAFPRLIGLGVNPALIGSSVNVVMAQRLVRILREDCREPYTLEGTEKAFVDRVLATIEDRSLIPQNTTTAYRAKTGGSCITGFRGRLAVFEAIEVTPAIEEMMNSSATEREIALEAAKQGTLTMIQDGVIKVLDGITTLEELARVIEVDIDTFNDHILS